MKTLTLDRDSVKVLLRLLDQTIPAIIETGDVFLDDGYVIFKDSGGDWQLLNKLSQALEEHFNLGQDGSELS